MVIHIIDNVAIKAELKILNALSQLCIPIERSRHPRVCVSRFRAIYNAAVKPAFVSVGKRVVIL